MPKGLEEVYEMMEAMAGAQRDMAKSLMSMADDLDAKVQEAKEGKGSDPEKFMADGDVDEDRMDQKIDKAIRVITLNRPE